MKVVCVYTGRKNGKGVNYARLALRAAREAGADETVLINLNELNIQPCIDCKACVRRLSEPGFTGTCPLKDDMDWLDEQFLSSDAMIYLAPMYENSAPGPYKIMCDRLGPSHDVTILKMIYNKQIENGITPTIDERFFRLRPVLYIGHGGSEWNYLSYPTIAIPSISLGLQVVDYVSIEWSNGALQDERADRIYQAGKHLVEMAALPPEKRSYAGDPGICPVCHSRVMRISDRADELTCALCGIIGTLVVENGRVRAEFTPEAMSVSHVLEKGRLQHMKDLREIGIKNATVDYSREKALAKELAEEFPLTRP